MLTVTCQSSAKLTPELIVTHLTVDAEYQETGNSTLSASIGGKKLKQDRRKGNTAVSSKDKKCFSCGRLRHWKDDCWRPGGRKEGQGPRQQAHKGRRRMKNKTANTAEDTQEESKVAFVCTSNFVEVANTLNVPPNAEL
jgi:hypothetical protein